MIYSHPFHPIIQRRRIGVGVFLFGDRIELTRFSRAASHSSADGTMSDENDSGMWRSSNSLIGNADDGIKVDYNNTNGNTSTPVGL